MVACFTRSSQLSFRAAISFFPQGFLSHHVQWTKRKTDNLQSRWLTECLKLVIRDRLFSLRKEKKQKSENYWYRQRIVRIVQDTSIQHI